MRGSLRQKGKDTWQLRVSRGVDPVSGKKREKTVTFHGGKREAENRLAELVSMMAKGEFAGSDATVAHLLAEYIRHRTDLSPSTLLHYRRRVDKRIVPALGRKRLSKLRASDLDRYYRGLAEDGHRPSDIRQDHAILRGALNWAVEWGWVGVNVATRAHPPKVRQIDLRPPTPDAIAVLIHAAKHGDDRHRPNTDLALFLRLLAALGARRGEVAGLQVGDYDPAARTVRVSRGVVEVGRDLIVKDTKTHAGRKMAVDDETAGELDAHIADLYAKGRAAGLPVGPRSFLFSNDLGATPWRPEYASLAFRRLCERTGAKVRLHDLRHAHATYLLAAGVSVRDVAARLGHANASTTLGVYAYALEAGDQAAAVIIGKLLTVAGAAPDAIGTGPPAD